jgi:hypothetical protein
MLHGCFHHEKERENVCPKCPLQLLFGNFFDRILRVLFGCIVYNDIDSAKFLCGLRNSFSTKFFPADIAFDQKAFAPVFFHHTPGFSRILLFFQVND